MPTTGQTGTPVENPYRKSDLTNELENKRVWGLPTEFKQTKEYAEALMPYPRRDDLPRKEILWS